MDEDKIQKLEEKLYNETPFLSDRIKKKALIELMEYRTIPAIETLCKALVYYQQSKFGKQIFSTLSQIKIQETDLINAVCRIWEENREPELSKLLKLKGWVASRPTQLRLVTALNLGWKGVIEEKGISIVKPLLSYLNDHEPWIRDTANQWIQCLDTSELQAEICRLATEENNQTALEVAIKNNYVPSEPVQLALFYYFTQQWEEYEKIDPQSIFLEEAYYNASISLQKRLDDHGQALNRMEWVWMRLGGKQGRRVTQIEMSGWDEIISHFFKGYNLQLAWSLIPYVPTVFAEKIIKKLSSKRLSIKEPKLKQELTELNNLLKQLSASTPPQGKLVRLCNRLEGHSQVIEAIAVSPDSKTLISAGGEAIYVWNLEDGSLQQTLASHLKPVTSLKFSSDGSMFASGSRDKTIILWRLPEGNMIANLSRNNTSIWSLAVTQDLKTIATAGYQEVRLWKYPPGSLAKALRGHKREVEKVLFDHSENLLITAGGTKDNRILVWSMPEGEKKYVLEGHTDGIWDLAITPDNSTLISAGKDGLIKVWSLLNGQEITTLMGHQGQIWSLIISPDGKSIISAGEDKTIKVWSLATYKIQYDLDENDSAIVCLDISRDSNLLVTGSINGIVKLWDLTTGNLMNKLTGHPLGVTVVKFSSNGETLITAGRDKAIKLWRWDLSRLANLPLMSFTTEDKQWLTETSNDHSILPQEKQWLDFIQRLLIVNS